MLSLLHRYFAAAGESAAQRAAIKSAAARTMSVAIRPMAEILTELPFAAAEDPRRAGPTFELAGDVYLPTTQAARWAMTFEQLDGIIGRCGELSEVAQDRLAAIGQTLGFMRRSLAQAAREA
jgi:hypothetical protein